MSQQPEARPQRLRKRAPLALLLISLLYLSGCSDRNLPPWFSEELGSEFSLKRSAGISSFEDYKRLEDTLFEELDKRVYLPTPTGIEHSLQRYSRGSISDPSSRQPNWNRSFELTNKQPSGAVLLLHGMTDSPYSLRALGETLHQHGYQVLGLRLPGHGTAPSGMLHVTWQDMSAAVSLAMSHLNASLGDKPIHIIGYSTGAALALDYVLQTQQGNAGKNPDSLVLISPAVGISGTAALAKWKRRLSLLPGLANLAWLQLEPEFDPYKYNSFTTNAAEQVHELTTSVARRIANRADESPMLPRILVLKSTVDATVSTDAVVDRLLMHLTPSRHELVLFDINRFAANSNILIADPGPLTGRLMSDDELPFALTLVGNTNADSRAVSVHHKIPYSADTSHSESLGVEWPAGVFSLSHVALPFPAQDPLYGRYAPADRNQLFLGQQPVQGERGLFKISGDFLLRLRHNPFYDYLEQRVVAWIE